MSSSTKLLVTAASLVLSATAGQTQESADPAYTPPRTAHDEPDFQGVWQVLNTAVWDIQDHSGRLGVPAGQGVVIGDVLPYQPWAAAQQQENFSNRLTADPEANCKMVGVPRITYMPYPFQIVQTPAQISILYEYAHSLRNIYMDSSPPRASARSHRGWEILAAIGTKTRW